MELDDRQTWTAINALRLAANRYLEHAVAMRQQPSPTFVPIAEQFERQAVEANDLANKLEG